MRLIIAAVLGGLVMFVWGAVGHMFLGIGEAGVMPMPNEAAMAAVMKESITEPGIYFLPGLDMKKQPSKEEWDAWSAKYKEGPTAMLIYHPTGDEPMSVKQMGVELASNIAAALVVGMILIFAYVSWGRGVIISTLIGLAAWLSINVSYWNWYGFPSNFVTSELIEQVVGWALSGFVMGYILRRRE
jgi:hypothetical protein